MSVISACPMPCDGINNIEDGAIDEEDDPLVEQLVKSGSTRAYEVLTFLTRDIAKSYSWKEAGTEAAQPGPGAGAGRFAPRPPPPGPTRTPRQCAPA